MSSENPFTGVRLNQLTETEVLMRNDRMSNNVLRFTSDMTDEERNEASRKYYLELATAQTMAPTKTAPQSATTEPLPYGWKERMVATYDLSVFQAGRQTTQPTPQTSTPAPQDAPVTNNSAKANLFSLMEAASEEVKKAQSDVVRVRKEMKELLAKLEGQDVESNMQYKMLKEELDEVTENYKHAQKKEMMLLNMSTQ